MKLSCPGPNARLLGAIALLSVLPIFAYDGLTQADGQGGSVEVTAPNVRLGQPIQTIDGFGVNGHRKFKRPFQIAESHPRVSDNGSCVNLAAAGPMAVRSTST